MNYEIIKINDKHYPQRLKQIKDPPDLIYGVGDISLLNTPSIAIIGSRDCTDYGVKICEVFSKELTNEGFTIVSGLARGIDGIAQKTCIDANGKTIAVLGRWI